MQSIDTGDMSETVEDCRNRPVVFQTHAEPEPLSRRRPIRVLATATLVIAAMAGATGLAFGGSAVWSVVGPKAPANEPAPLWIQEPTPVGALTHNLNSDGDRSGSDDGATGTPAQPSNSEPGDHRGGGAGSVSGTGGTGSTPGTTGATPHGMGDGGPGPDVSGGHSGGGSGGSRGESGQH